jgi:membrane fusion protein (multidrug efflux system)
LKDEQRRLREEQERLRHQGNGSNGGHAGTKPDGTERDGQKNQQDGNGQGKNGHQEKTQGDNQKQDNENHPKEQPKPPLKQRVRICVCSHQKQVTIGVIAFVVLCIAGAFLLLYLRSYESTDDAQVDGHLNAVSTRVMGTVQRVYVEDNQTVAAGQLLLELDPRDFETALAQAKATYASAEAQWKAENPNAPIVRTSNESDITTNQESVEGARAAVVASEQDYQARLASLRQTEANDTKAQRDLVRYRALVNKEEISHEQCDSYVAAAKTQAAGVVAAQAAAETAQKAIEQRRAQLAQVQARLNESKQNAPCSVAIRQASTAARKRPFLQRVRRWTRPHSTSRTQKSMRPPPAS